ncbi:MAG: DotU family type IV/VI secretion system protein [Planctomycetales bacterium]|jgi:hypothetical protein
MGEEFNVKVFAILHYVLKLRNNLEEGVAVEFEPVKMGMLRLLGQFNVSGAMSSHYELARAALVFWTDEVLINSQWVYAERWRNSPLELELYGTRQRAWRFFELAEQARSLTGTDVLEVFALCAASGFRGIYRNSNRMLTDGPLVFQQSPASVTPAASKGIYSGVADDIATSKIVKSLPPTLTEWAVAAFSEVVSGNVETFAPHAPYDSVRNANPLDAGRALVRWLVILVVSIFLMAGLTFLS